MTPWKQLSSQYIHQSHWLNLRADRCEIAPGKVIEPYYVIETMDWVHVVAITPSHQILLVRQYRYAAQSVCEEIPGGLRDDGESPLETAKRELKEEAGATAMHWTHLLSAYPDPARLNNRVHTFLAEGVEITGAQALDHSEEIHAYAVPFDEVEGMIADGRFSQSTQIASYYLARRHLEREGKI